MNLIEVEHLTKRYKDTVAVDDLSFSVRKGELFALLGVNGAGKTTTIKMLSTVTLPTSGEAWLSGKSVKKDPDAVRRLIGVSPQETAVAPNLTVLENLNLFAEIHGFTKKKRDSRVSELLQSFSLTPYQNKWAGKLSGGWQRRLSIAISLLSDPEILFLDEPTLGLDVLARAELWDFIRGLKGNMTVILTTHYMEEAEALSDRVGIMKNGKMLDVLTVEGWKERTGCSRFDEAFIAAVKEKTK